MNGKKTVNNEALTNGKKKALLSNQAAMAQYLSAIYDASIGTEAAEGAVQKRFQQTQAHQLQSVNDAEAAMAYCRDEVLPELV